MLVELNTIPLGIALGVVSGIIVYFSLIWISHRFGDWIKPIVAVLSIVVAAIATGISSAPPATGSPPVSTQEFRLVFGRDPPSDVEIIDSESSIKEGATWAVVRFRVGIEDLEDLVSGWLPGSISVDDLPKENWSLDDCKDERAYLDKPEWRRRQYSAVLYCADDDSAEAIYRKRD